LLIPFLANFGIFTNTHTNKHPFPLTTLFYNTFLEDLQGPKHYTVSIREWTIRLSWMGFHDKDTGRPAEHGTVNSYTLL